MAFSISFSTPLDLPILRTRRNKSLTSCPVSISFSPLLHEGNCNSIPLRVVSVAASSNSPSGQQIKKRSSSNSGSKKKKKKIKEKSRGEPFDDSDWSDFEIVGDYRQEGDHAHESSTSAPGSSPDSNSRSGPLSTYQPAAMPKPPAGFVVDETGRVLMASRKRIATIVDSTNNSPLECVIRRVFTSSKEDECMLLCPVDMPVQILKSTNIEGWSAVSDEEVEAVLPAAAYALAKIHMHLVHSGFCYTARGGFCYTEDDIFDFRTDDGQDIEGLPTEGIEVTCFNLVFKDLLFDLYITDFLKTFMDGAHYMIYTPSDPLLFVAVRDQNGQLQIADDDVLEDPAVTSAIDEETEFNALVEEEAALLESLVGER